MVVSGAWDHRFARQFGPQSAQAFCSQVQARDEPTRLRAAREIGFETLVVGPGLVTLDEQVLHFSLKEPMLSWKHPVRTWLCPNHGIPFGRTEL